MIVCSCRAVSDRVVHGAILSGATGPDDVTERCGAGGDCGSCLATVEAMLAAVRGAEPADAAA